MKTLSITALVVIGLCGPPSSKAQGSGGIPIEHYIFIIQENHSFDSYFGTFPGANGIPAGTALADFPGGPLVNQPFLMTVTHIPHDLPHSWLAARVDYHNGAMDGFMWGEYQLGNTYYGQGIPVPRPNHALVKIQPRSQASPSPLVSLKTKVHKNKTRQEILSPNGFADDEDAAAPNVQALNDAIPQAVTTASPDPNLRPSWVKYTLGHMDKTIIPNYWDYASKYTLCDAFFSSITGPSMPNHLYVVAAQSGGLVNNQGIANTPFTGGNVGIFSFPSVIELLGNANVAWKYYSDNTYPTTETNWNLLPGFQAFAGNPDLTQKLVATSQFYTDLTNGTLPQVCWLIPNQAESEHPPADVTVGMAYVTTLVNAVMQSPYWANCAIIITWDDYGGFYDHVPPVQIDGYGFGFRVPTIVISPYSKVGVNHTQYDFTSLLKLVETKFGLSSLTTRDGSSNTMLECFDFSQTPLPTDILTP
jgi:phospholipase C